MEKASDKSSLSIAHKKQFTSRVFSENNYIFLILTKENLYVFIQIFKA